jgi:thioredoxin reductase (NADPH)
MAPASRGERPDHPPRGRERPPQAGPEELAGPARGWTLDRDPYIFETNVPGIFAAGDVRSGANRRVATAVGEGSASIHAVLKYLMEV